MTKHVAFDVFTRSTFGVEPGGQLARQLQAMAASISLPPGRAASLDRSRDKIAYMAHGATKLSARASGDREQIVAFHFGGDIVSIPAESLYSYDLTSLAETELLVFPAREFFDHVAGEPTIARALFDRIPAALHRCRDKAVALGRKSAAERMAGFLITMSDRVGTIEDNRGALDLPMSRRDISDSLGLTIETVSRQLGILRKAGLIETYGRSQIALLDLGELARRAGHPDPEAKNPDRSSKFDLDQCSDEAPPLAVNPTKGA